MTHTSCCHSSSSKRKWLIPAFVVIVAIGIAVAYANGYGNALLNFLPLLLLAACPLMHLFMHRQEHSGHDAPKTVEVKMPTERLNH